MKYANYVEELGKLPHKESGQSLAELFKDDIDVWSNGACIGYCKAALKRAKLDKETIDKVIKQLYNVIEENTVDQAEQVLLYAE